MPEVLFRVRWPDKVVSRCYSPSRAITSFLDPGAEYPLDDFMRRSRQGLQAASDRVRQIYGMPCSRASAQLAELERMSARFAGQSDARVTIEAMENPEGSI